MRGLIFIVVLVLYIWAEITVFVSTSQIFGDFGPLLVIAATIATAIIGVRMFRRQGAGTLQRLATSAMRGESPLRSIADGGALLLAAGLLLIPGFITDTLGLVLFVPGLRSWLALALFGIGRRGGRHGQTRGKQGKTADNPDFASTEGTRDGTAKKNPSEVIIEGEFERKD